MGKLTIAEAVKTEMVARKIDSVWSGEPDLCISAYIKTGGKVSHPSNRIKAVIDAVRNSDLFYSDGYIRACDSTCKREILHPCFKLKT